MELSNERLREIANHEVADTSERKAMAAELLAARELDVQRLKQIKILQDIIGGDLTPAGIEVARYREEIGSVKADRDRLRAELDEAKAQIAARQEPSAIDELRRLVGFTMPPTVGPLGWRDCQHWFRTLLTERIAELEAAPPNPLRSAAQACIDHSYQKPMDPEVSIPSGYFDDLRTALGEQ
jgi:hypothetical protein